MTSLVRANLCAPLERVTLPIMALPGELISVPATVNGHTMTMVVDTGASIGLLSDAKAKEMSLDSEWRRRPFAWMYGGKPVQNMARNTTVRFGAMPGLSSEFGVVPRSFLPASSADGVVGANVLSAYDVLIDFEQHSLTLSVTNRCGAAPTIYQKLRMLDANGHHVLIPVELDGEKLEAVIDTGAERSLISLRAACILIADRCRKHDLQSDGAYTINGSSIGTIYGYSFHMLRMADVKIPNPEIQVIEESEQAHIPDLILGMNILSRFRLDFDYKARTLFLAPIQ